MTRRPDPAANHPPEDSAPGDRVVHSERAGPSRPAGYAGVRQPMEPLPGHPEPAKGGDGELARAVCTAFDDDGRLEAQQIEVRVAGGIVSLDGRVALEFQRTLASALAQSVPGVLSVSNRLAVAEH